MSTWPPWSNPVVRLDRACVRCGTRFVEEYELGGLAGARIGVAIGERVAGRRLRLLRRVLMAHECAPPFRSIDVNALCPACRAQLDELRADVRMRVGGARNQYDSLRNIPASTYDDMMGAWDGVKKRFLGTSPETTRVTLVLDADDVLRLGDPPPPTPGCIKCEISLSGAVSRIPKGGGTRHATRSSEVAGNPAK